jgi:RNA polymerase sigma-70 factor (ECF subfamily)
VLTDEDQRAVACGLRDGQQAAWTRLYDAYCQEVWRYVARLVGDDTATVADIVQEVFLAAAGAARTYDPARGTLRAWLLGIAHRQTAFHWRAAARAGRWRQLAAAGATRFRQWLDDSDAPGDASERLELGDLVRGVLAELTADDAVLLLGKYADELSLEQLAEQSGRSVEAVKSKLARARREFRQQFTQRTGTDPGARQP